MSFLQLTPQNIKQARSLSYPEAFILDRTLGFNPNFKGGVGPAKYIGEGLKSLIGFGDPNIGGATPLTRKLALDAADLFKSGIGFAAKRAAPFISLFGSTELGADEPITQAMRDEIDITNQLDDYYEKGEMMDNVADAPEAGITTKLLDAIKGAGSAISNLGIVGALKNLDQFKNLSPLDQRFILEQAGGNRPAKDRFGYNIRSAFGNYANLVANKALRADTKARFGIPLNAMDIYYQNQEKERAAAERAVLDAYFAQQSGDTGGGGDSGDRYDGASSFEEYSADPTGFSGSS